MIIIRLWGGLGNQLFQYAFGYAIAKSRNEELILDTRFFSNDYQKKNKRFTNRFPEILKLPLIYKNQTIPSEIIKKVCFLQKKTINRIIRIPKQSSIKLTKKFKYIKESRFNYNKFFEKIEFENLYFDGYWQCEKYFRNYREELIKQFLPCCDIKKYEQIYFEIQNSNSVCVHIRRGDYKNSKRSYGNLSVLPIEYYEKAIYEAKTKLNNSKFFIFSDDIKWAQENFGESSDFVYVSGQKDIDTLNEFFLMSQCKNQIIANSTFSWWAAWLNKNSEKIVWCPNMWFGNRDILPKDWVKVSIE